MKIKRYVVEYTLASMLKYVLFVLIALFVIQGWLHRPIEQLWTHDNVQTVKLVVLNHTSFAADFTVKLNPYQNANFTLSNYIISRAVAHRYYTSPRFIERDVHYTYSDDDEEDVDGIKVVLHNPTNKPVNATFEQVYNLGYIPHIIGFGLFAKHIESPNCTPAFENSSQQTVAFFCPKETSMDKLFLSINKGLSKIGIDNNTAGMLGFLLPYLLVFFLLFVLPFIDGLKHEQKISIAKLYLAQPRDVEDMVPEMAEDIKEYMKQHNLTRKQLDPLDHFVLNEVDKKELKILYKKLKKVQKKMNEENAKLIPLGTLMISFVFFGLFMALLFLIFFINYLSTSLFHFQILADGLKLQSPFVPSYFFTFFLSSMISFALVFFYHSGGPLTYQVRGFIIREGMRALYALPDALPLPQNIKYFIKKGLAIVHHVLNLMVCVYFPDYVPLLGYWVRSSLR